MKKLGHLLAWFLGLIWVLPFVGLFVASIRPGDQLNHGWWNLENFSLTMENYYRVLVTSSIPMLRPLLNSAYISFLGTATPIVIGSLAAYAFARKYIPGKRIILMVLLSLMAIPLQMVAIPMFQIINKLNLLDTYWSLTILNTATGIPWIVFFLSNFIKGQPLEVEEAAQIDGCSSLAIFTRIVLPQTKPAFISVFVLQFVWCWLDFFLPLLFIYSPDKYTAVQVIPMLRGQFVTNWGLLSAASILVTAVPLLIFLFLQKYYIASSVGWVPEK
ncbi:MULTISPECIES: carbohydrate ABC transporter permease [unclassified Oceanispirochaeta]|uniref:carbohydrate ABC transporter permease n=1 Tax=unclassified Oceanispirochaeta TaxID=2635722 RepID=UPI000E095FA0|nr:MULTISPECIES: carbohydrate ABC transporter permease [unclassified Oceanispirochaeta]MBF9016523.1 carbohydrate ABC transporter permease [Oceanispirochaeta sp. M2]NPD72985.1 carbohydrate ABC transporter permease [Oceanispirochaeta sp. M1]RDG31329.1 carbohydrate ABC transporter permease [Oceanispirochaeta sp. M1]